LWSETEFFRPRLLKLDEETLTFEDGEVNYVLLDGETIFGYMEYFYRDNGLATIGYGLLEEYQSKGFGTKMVEFLLAECKEKGMRSVRGSVEKINYKSILLLYKLGFRVIDDQGEIIIMQRDI
jgi:RimJ/RimL family protein N-acetyltransferase